MRRQGLLSAGVLLVRLREDGDRTWTTAALALPKVRVIQVRDDRGTPVPFELRDGAIVADAPPGGMLEAQVELGETLVAQSDLDATKLGLERAKVEAEDRGRRWTVLASVVSAMITAASGVAVAVVAQSGEKSSAKAPPTFRELTLCRESLDRLMTLSRLDGQTLAALRDAVARHADTCSDRLRAAAEAAGS